jgi:hypothetical protein
MVADGDVGLDQTQLRSDLPVMSQTVEQPDQRYLCVWFGIDPQFDGFAPVAEVDQSDFVPIDLTEVLPIQIPQPMIARLVMLRRSANQRCELRV